MENLSEDDDELEIVELKEGQPIPPPPAENVDEQRGQAPPGDEDEGDEGDEHGEDDGGDQRLATSQDDHDEAIDPKKKKRQERAQRQKLARERDERERAALRADNAELRARLERLEGGHIESSAAQIDERLAAAQSRIDQLTAIIGKAVEAGNGDDVAAAMKLRDEAFDARSTLFAEKARVDTVRTAPPQADRRVTELADQWKAANPWYTHGGTDEDSMVTAAIDAAILREGYNPADMSYWQELTRRVSARLGGDDEVDDREPRREQPPRRKAPPQGSTREHVPQSTRNQVYVTPERKQAMIESGAWDDPVRRKRQLAEYARWDRENAAR